jgi:cell wall-associated NlpC family hydrolase
MNQHNKRFFNFSAKLPMALLVLTILYISGCQKESVVTDKFNTSLQKIAVRYIPDKALAVLDAKLERVKNRWVLIGETTEAQAAKALRLFADSLLGKGGYDDKLMLLPHPELGDSCYAIVNVSVTQLRDRPAHAAQIVDQVIMGSVLRLLKYNGGWYLAQTDYDYVGWVDFTALHRTDSAGVAAWQQAAQAVVRGLYPIVYTEPSQNAEPVSDVVLNTRLKPIAQLREWVKVALPDGRMGYLRANQVAPLSTATPKLSEKTVRQRIIATARRMMGVPYLWGGNSSKGNDCSGFTQTVFKANGLQLPRDSRQQALAGIEIVPNEDWSNVLPGDLLFFGTGERVTHVGISLGGKSFIHQGGKVAINSLDPNSPVFSPYRAKSFMFARRIILPNSTSGRG